MNHSLFRDLLSNYIENLTSNETNEQMESHMEECPECSELFNQLREETVLGNESEQQQEKKVIDILKKVREKNKKKIIIICSILISLFIVLGLAYYFVFINMWNANSKDIETSVSHLGKTVTLNFKAKNKNHYLILSSTGVAGAGGNSDIKVVYEKRKDLSEISSMLKDGSTISYTFIDEETLLLPNGKELILSDDDTIQIIFKDKTEKINIKKLYYK